MNFSNYTKETFTPKLVELYKSKWKAKKGTQYTFANAMNDLYEKYDIRDRKGEELRSCTHQQVSQWLNGTFPDEENFRCICEILGVDPEHFTSPTEKELYKFSQGYMTDIGENKLLPYCDEIGLDPKFLVVISSLIGEDLGTQFPFWTPIDWTGEVFPEDCQFFKHIDPMVFWSNSAQMTPKVEMFQIEVTNEKDDTDEKKLLTLSFPDLRFLRDVQDEVRDYVEFLFLKRKKELKREGEEASRRALVPLKGGGKGFKGVSPEDLNEIDKYFHNYVEKKPKTETSGKDGEEGEINANNQTS